MEVQRRSEGDLRLPVLPLGGPSVWFQRASPSSCSVWEPRSFHIKGEWQHGWRWRLAELSSCAINKWPASHRLEHGEDQNEGKEGQRGQIHFSLPEQILLIYYTNTMDQFLPFKHKGISEVQLMLGDQVWLTFGILVHPKGLGWGKKNNFFM